MTNGDGDNGWFKEYLRTIVDTQKTINDNIMKLVDGQAHTEECMDGLAKLTMLHNKRLMWVIAGMLTLIAGLVGVKVYFPGVIP